MASPPVSSSSHNDSGESIPPGKRQLIATMAIGSALATAARLAGVALLAVLPAS